MSKDIPILYITYSIIIIKDSILSLLIITKRTFDLFHLKQGSPPPTSGGKLRALFARFTYSIIIIKDSILSLLIITKRTFDLFHLKQGSPPPTSGGKLRALFARFHLKRGSISYFISPQWRKAKSSLRSLSS